MIAFLTCTNSRSKCSSLRKPKLQLKSCRFGLFLFCSCVSSENQGPNTRESFAKQNSALAMMLTCRLRVEVLQCSNAIQADTLVVYWYACPLFPRQLTRTKHSAGASQIFCLGTSFWLTHSFALAKFKKKERKKEKMFPTLTPTLGLFFVVPFVVIDSLEPSGMRHCPKSYLNLACFAAGPSCSRLFNFYVFHEIPDPF